MKTKPSFPAPAAIETLVDVARRARAHAYAPYSRYRVGAALFTETGAVYAGVNVENASYPVGLCAERAALAAMVTSGDRRFLACAIVTDGMNPAAPCGMCRQALIEFADDAEIVLVGESGGDEVTRRVLRLSELLPEVFRLDTSRSGPPSR